MKERLFESPEKAQGSGKKSVRWRFVWIMLGVFLIGMAALLLYHRFSMNGLIEDKLEKLRSEMVINCAALDDEIYMTSAIPSAVNKSNYYTFIKYDQSEQLDRKYYSVLEFIREDFAKQVYLRGSASESLLYFRGTDSICTTRHTYPVAGDCFAKGLLFEATPSEKLISTLRDAHGVLVLPSEWVTIENGQRQKYLPVIIRDSGSNITIMSLYEKKTFTDALNISAWDEADYSLVIFSQSGSELFACGTLGEADGYTVSAPLGKLRCHVVLTFSPKIITRTLEASRLRGFLIIGVSLMLGLLAAFLLSEVSVRPIRRIIMNHGSDAQGMGGNEIDRIEDLLLSSEQQIGQQKKKLQRNMLLLALSGAVLSPEDMECLRSYLLPEGSSYCIAIIHGAARSIRSLSAGSLDDERDLFSTTISSGEIGVYIRTASAVKELADFINRSNLLFDDEKDKLHCGISRPCGDFDHFYDALHQARMAVPMNGGCRIYDSAAENHSAGLRLLYERLYSRVIAENRDQALEVLEGIGRQLNNQNRHELFYNVRFFLLNAAEEFDMDGIDQILPRYEEKLLPAENFGKMKDFLNAILAFRLEREEQSRADRRRQIMEYIRDGASEPDMCVQKAADEFGLSERYLYDIVRGECGMSFTEYLTQVRMRKAKELLYTSTMTVNEISAACGYDVPSTFYRVFKKFYGVSPKQYAESKNESEGKAE